MKRISSPLWKVSPTRTLVEGWLVCFILLIPVIGILLETTPLARSLYLVLLPLVCALVAGLRLRFFSGHFVQVVTKECGLALLLSLGILGTVFGLMASLAQLDSIKHSYARTGGTIFFIMMVVPEYLGVRVASWAWKRWDQLRHRRYVWALTHAILRVVAGAGLLIMIGAIFYIANILRNDIWQIPTESPFAQFVFWLTVLVLLLFLLSVSGIILFLPPATLFSFLVARKMTTRLESLAAATQALRSGNLSTRVSLTGEDEIAQLQTDFNVMAADLEESVAALQVEKDKVWRLLEAQRDLIAGISHELRNPVATILSYNDVLRREWTDRSPQEVERDLDTIQYEASHLQTILNDLLTASQADAGYLSMSLQAVNVTVLLQRLVETFSVLAWSNKRAQVTLSAPPHGIFALADALRLEQVLVNLLQNAVRHTSPGGLVALEVHQDPEGICIEVEDTGEGISPEDLPHIWEKYYRTTSSQHRSQYGTGLGLSLVKELTEAMGGTVSVESWPGQGSLFQVHLPACIPADEAS